MQQNSTTYKVDGKDALGLYMVKLALKGFFLIFIGGHGGSLMRGTQITPSNDEIDF